ncbi:MAG: LamG domain-containing protein, partial [Phycisphaerales bacterium]
MSRGVILLISLALMLVAADSASAELVAHWRLDETSGTIAHDSSGYGNDGTLNGSPRWVAGKIGGALHFDGSSDYVQIPFSESLRVHNQGDFTNAAWFKFDAVGIGRQVIFQQATLNGTGRSWLQINPNDVFTTWLGGAQIFSGVSMQAEEWYHGAVVVTEGGVADSIQLYVNGEPAGAAAQGGIEDCEGGFFIGCQRNIQWFMDGLIDDVRIYREELTPEDIQIVMEGIEGRYPLATGPAPEDGALYEQIWATLRWTPGDWAVSHDLYFGTNFNDVNDGAAGTLVGNLTIAQQVVGFPGFPAPQGLEPGTTYYWRVDEVNDANDQSPWKGNVWSFRIRPKNAYDPIPADGGTFADPNVDLSWAAGLKAVMEAVYFGTDPDEVANAAGAPSVMDATFDPGPLAPDTTHYWRVDTFDGLEWTKGEVWSFSTLPDVAIADPDLTVWWTLDEGPGSLTVVDRSGHGHHGTFVSSPQWADGVSGAALQFDGLDDYVINQLPQAQNFDSFTVALWAKAGALRQGQFMSPFSSHTPNSLGFQIDVDGTSPGNYRTNTNQPPGPAFGPVTLRWVHLAFVAEGTTLQYYYNGTWANSYTYSTDELLFNEFIIGSSRNNANYFDGAVDDLRVYTKALTQDEIQLVMRGDLLLAWNASPANGSVPNLRDATPLSWSPGDNAS